MQTIQKPAEGEGKYIWQAGGVCNYGHCRLRLEPNKHDQGYEFVNEIKGGVVPTEYLGVIDQSVREVLESGIATGYPMVDIKVTLFDGSYHEVNSSETSFRIAASMAFNDAVKKASPVVLEPIMALEIALPEEQTGTIVLDISSRRGRISGLEHTDGWQIIKAMVPLAEVLGFGRHFQYNTRGQARHSMRFLRYEPAPQHGGFGDTGAGVTADKTQEPKSKERFCCQEHVSEC